MKGRWNPSVFPLLYNRRIPQQVEHFLSISSFRGIPTTHQSTHPSIHPPIHPLISSSSSSSSSPSILPSTKLAHLRTSSTYLPLATYQSPPRAGSSFLPAKTPIGPQPHSSCDLHGALPSLARDLTRHTHSHTPFITIVQPPRRIHHYVFSSTT